MAYENSVQAEATPQEKTPVADKTVTDADLSSAWDSQQTQEQTEKVETKEEPKEEVQEEKQEAAPKESQEPEELPEEPADNAERSRLGRRLKQMEETQKQLLDEIKSLIGGQPQQPQQQQVPENVTYDDRFVQSQIDAAVERGEIPSTIVTPQDQLVVNRFIGGLQQQIGNQYARQYLGTLTSPKLKGDTPDDIHAEVVTELQRVESPFNLRRYNNPALDAQMNYLEAKNAILLKKFTEKPESVFKGKPKDAPATGTSVSTRTAAVNNDLPELDAASQDFIKRTGMSPESVRNALKNEMPYYLRGR
jgi:hypothetical protein